MRTRVMTTLKKTFLNFTGVGAVLLFAVASGVVLAQDPDPVKVSLSQETAQSDGDAEVSFTFEGNGESSAFGAVNINYDPTGIDSIDLSDCLDGTNAMISTCVHPGGGDHTTGQIRITLSNDSSTELQDFTGVIKFVF